MDMKLLINTLFISFLTYFSFAQEQSILFIGNSYTYGNDLPILVKNLATANGKSLYVDSYAVGGATFANHASNAQVMNKIKSRKWDYVIIQGQSQEPAFPNNQVDSYSLPAAVRLSDSVYANNYCTEVMYFMTWGRKNGDPQWGPISTYEGMQQRLYDGYMRIADSSQASVAAVGKVWQSIRNSIPGVELYQSDESHPTLAGSYLSAMVIYSSIFLEKAINFVGNAGLSNDFLTQINIHIENDLLNNQSLYHLRPQNKHTKIEFHQINQNANSITGSMITRKAQSVNWSFGDGDNSNSLIVNHSYNQLGNFQIQLVAQSVCNYDTIIKTIEVETLSLSEVEKDIYSLMNKVLKIEPSQNGEIYSVNGILLADFVSEIDLRNFQSGIYLLLYRDSLYKFYLN